MLQAIAYGETNPEALAGFADRLVPRLGHNQTIGAVAHRLCRLIWLILRKAVRYEERGPAVSQRSRQNRTSKMIRDLRTLGYRMEFLNAYPAIQYRKSGFSTVSER